MEIYYGDVPLCYTNSLAMTLSAYGYDFHPEYLEALMAMGNGANFLNDDSQHPIVFFDNGEPDTSISHTLDILGFDFDDFFLRDGDEIDETKIREMLQSFLKKGPVIVGPLDMSYLTYNPHHANLQGVDHFVSLYDFIGEDVYLHDPAGYPCVHMDFKDFFQAWRADAIGYKRGCFSMWGNLKQVKHPSPEEIYHELSLLMKERYLAGQANVIEAYAKAIGSYGLNQQQKQVHEFFSFRLASARNIYLSRFLQKHDPKRAQLKEEIASLFGQAYLDSLQNDFIGLAKRLLKISKLDKQFKELCIQYKAHNILDIMVPVKNEG